MLLVGVAMPIRVRNELKPLSARYERYSGSKGNRGSEGGPRTA